MDFYAQNNWLSIFMPQKIALCVESVLVCTVYIIN